MWSKDKVKQAMKNPKALQQGFSNDFFDLGMDWPIVSFAGSRITKCPIPIAIGGVPLLEIKPPENSGDNFLLSANFTNSDGAESVIIKENEWFSSSDNWDVTVQAGVLTVWENKGSKSLQLTAKPPNELVVDHIKMSVNGIKILGNKEQFFVERQDKGVSCFSGCLSSYSPVGFNL